MSDLLEQYERETGVVWLNYNMTSDDWQKRVDWLEAKIAPIKPEQTLVEKKLRVLRSAVDDMRGIFRDLYA